MLDLPQPAVWCKGQTIGRAVSGAPGLRQRKVRPSEGICSQDRSSLRGFGILRWVDHGDAGRASLPSHRIAFCRLAIQGQAKDLAQGLVGILSRRHALAIAYGKEQIFAIRGEGYGST